MSENEPIRYFPGLTGLRFIAAFFVLISHAYQTVVKNGMLPEITSNVIFESGSAAVDFFFTLSGFLITYLLLAEHSATGTISLSGFYLRRVCRIWPLYFLVLAIGIVLLEGLYPRLYHVRYFDWSLPEGILFYVFFLPNFMFSYHKVGLLSPLWSIGIEEQFYLFWAPIVKLCRGRILPVILGITVAVAALQITVGDSFFGISGRVKFLQTLRFHYMGVGALFAWMLFSHPSRFLRSWVTSKWFQSLMLGVLLYHYTFRLPFRNHGVADIPLSLCYAALIINVSVGPQRWMNLEWEPLRYLGQISYGIYMYHMIVDYGLRIVFQALGWLTPSTLAAVAYGLVQLTLTIGVAHVSYQHLERRCVRCAGRH